MKTLKKVISVALALVLALSLVTIAGAATTTTPKYQDYSDASSITNKEAVDTLTSLGILQGSDGAYNPSANVTREQAAKIIAYMLLGQTSADSLKTSVAPFSDVAADRWSAPVIQYCVVKGIINGMGDGTFAPEANVTAAQFAKMLLTALGYGKLGEFTGSDWSINTIVDAQNLGILTTDVDYTAAATRDQVALYAFNAYTGDKCGFVVLSNDISSYKADETKTYTNASGTKTYGANLAQTQSVFTSSNRIVENGFVSHEWAKKGTVLTNNWWPDADQTVLATSGWMGFSFLCDTSSDYYVCSLNSDASQMSYFVNGKQVSYATFTSTTDADRAAGTVTFIDTNNDGKAEVVSSVKKTFSKVTAAPIVSTTASTVSIPGVSGISGVSTKLVDGYKNLAKGDYVLWYLDNATGIYHIQKATQVKGQITSASYGFLTIVTFGGKMTFASGVTMAVDSTKSLNNFIWNSTTNAYKTNNFNVDATAYVDDSGSIIWIQADSATTAQTYGLVVGYAYNGTALVGSAQMKLIKQDGTVGVYTQAAESDGTVKNYGFTYPTAAQATASPDTYTTRYLVAYTVKSDGTVYINAAYNDSTGAAANGASAYTIANAFAAGDSNIDNGTYFISSTTKVIYFNDGALYSSTNSGSVVTGYASTIAVGAGTKVLAYSESGTNIPTILVVDTTKTATQSANFLYVPSTFGSAGSARYVNGSLVYDFYVYVGGVTKTLTSATYGFLPAGLSKYALDTNGYITAISSTEADYVYVPATGATGYVTIVDSGNYFVYQNDATGATTKAVLFDSNTKFYEVKNASNQIASIAAGSVDESSTALQYKVLAYDTNKDGVALEVFYQTTTNDNFTA